MQGNRSEYSDTEDLPPATVTTAIVEVVHVTIICGRSFDAVHEALLRDVPALDPELIQMLVGANAAEIAGRRAVGPKLWLFETRDHGALVAADGQAKKAIQFEIGNPLTAERMTSHHLASGLYAPLRIILYDDPRGRTILEYDLPSSLFNQSQNEDVAKIGYELDHELKQVLLAAAG